MMSVILGVLAAVYIRKICLLHPQLAHREMIRYNIPEYKKSNNIIISEGVLCAKTALLLC